MLNAINPNDFSEEDIAFTTEAEAVALLDALTQFDGDDYRDPEDAHKQADAILVKALELAGWPDLANLFQERRGEFWYS